MFKLLSYLLLAYLFTSFLRFVFKILTKRTPIKAEQKNQAQEQVGVFEAEYTVISKD